MQFIKYLEEILKIKSKKNYLSLQKGDVNTLSDTSLIQKLNGKTKPIVQRREFINSLSGTKVIIINKLINKYYNVENNYLDNKKTGLDRIFYFNLLFS